MRMAGHVHQNGLQRHIAENSNRTAWRAVEPALHGGNHAPHRSNGDRFGRSKVQTKQRNDRALPGFQAIGRHGESQDERRLHDHAGRLRAALPVVRQRRSGGERELERRERRREDGGAQRGRMRSSQNQRVRPVIGRDRHRHHGTTEHFVERTTLQTHRDR